MHASNTCIRLCRLLHVAYQVTSLCTDPSGFCKFPGACESKANPDGGIKPLTPRPKQSSLHVLRPRFSFQLFLGTCTLPYKISTQPSLRPWRCLFRRKASRDPTDLFPAWPPVDRWRVRAMDRCRHGGYEGDVQTLIQLPFWPSILLVTALIIIIWIHWRAFLQEMQYKLICCVCVCIYIHIHIYI